MKIKIGYNNWSRQFESVNSAQDLKKCIKLAFDEWIMFSGNTPFTVKPMMMAAWAINTFYLCPPSVAESQRYTIRAKYKCSETNYDELFNELIRSKTFGEQLAGLSQFVGTEKPILKIVK